MRKKQLRNNGYNAELTKVKPYTRPTSLKIWPGQEDVEDGNDVAHNWAVHMHSPNVVPRTDFEGHTTSGVNNL